MNIREYFLCAKKTIYLTIIVPELLSSAILESTPERNPRMLNLMLIRSGVLSKMAEDGN